MGFIKRWNNDKKLARRIKIGEFIPCPICTKVGLATWEGERYMRCKFCGANYQKKQKYVRKRDTIINKDIVKQQHV